MALPIDDQPPTVDQVMRAQQIERDMNAALLENVASLQTMQGLFKAILGNNKPAE